MKEDLEAQAALSPAEKRAMLTRLLKQRADQEIVERPLAYGQQALWFLHQLDPKSPAYNILCAARLRHDVDRNALARALQEIVRRHAVLRTTYASKDGAPVQRVHGFAELKLETVDARDWSNDQLDRQMRQAADLPFNLATGPVLRATLFDRGDTLPVLFLVTHHIALDFWSFDLMFEELEKLYRAQVTGQPADLAPPAAEYTDFVAWQAEMLDSKESERHWEYWEEQLAGELPDLDLPCDRPRPPVQSFHGTAYPFALDDELSAGLAKLAKEHGATLFATLLAAFQVLLSRLSGQEDILVGSPTAGRSRAEFESCLGYFINPVVMRSKVAADLPFSEFLARVRQTTIGGIAHQDFPFPLVVEQLQPPRDPSRSPIFQVAFNWDAPRRWFGGASAGDAPSVGGERGAAGRNGNGRPLERLMDPGDLGLELFALGQQGAALDLALMMLKSGHSLSAALQYNSDLFDESTMRRWAGHFQTLLRAIVADPTRALGDLPLLWTDEEHRVLTEWNATDREFPREACVHTLFERQAGQTPDAIAVVAGEQSITYGELDRRSNQVARYLRREGAEPRARVAIYVDRSIDMVVSLLGILKAGCSYVPLAPGIPAERISYIAEEAGVSHVVTKASILEELPDVFSRLVLVDAQWRQIAREDAGPLEPTATPVDLAYTMFTSGSTGKPKGVELEHRSVVNFLNSMAREPGISADDRLLAVTTLTFDISVLELFLPLSVGAQVVLIERDVAADGVRLARLLESSGATIMQATPATWRLLVEAGWPGKKDLKILCGGEAMPRDLAEQLLVRSASLWNMYGPTETTVWSATGRVTSGKGSVSIGRPIDNTSIYILDSRRRAAPIGVAGKLYIGGDGLARGYLNRPELTAERFVEHTFAFGRRERLYDTGDLARWRADGQIDFLGRDDFQVKIRGFRIELGEIEAVLVRHPQVRQVVVISRQTGARDDDKQLAAYIVPEGNEEPDATSLREFLRRQLPDYMVPAIFVSLAELPLNPAGKIDRKALPQPAVARPKLRAEYVPPRTPLEQQLAEIWLSVLDVDQVGVYDNLFELGGASLQSLEIATRASAEGLEVSPAMLFQFPTIAELAATLEAPPRESDTATQLESAVEAPQAAEPIDTQPHASGVLDQVDVSTNGHSDSGPLLAELVDESPMTAPAVSADAPGRPATTKRNVVIESLGVYLPPTEVTTKEVIQGCNHKIWFPFERMTGIHSRRMAGETEFSIDLAEKAARECLAHSKYGVDDVELVICSNITRFDHPDKVSVEPNTSMRLKERLGFPNAVVYDITNACAGMFTAIQVVEAYLRSGQIRRGMVVSGEYITAITRTAQKEICEFMDPRIACLTVGDAGAAVMLEVAETNDVGFHELELYSLTKYAEMCIGKLTDQPHGGPILVVPDPLEHTSVAIKHSVENALHVFRRSPWPPEKLNHLIMHQTSDRSLRGGRRAIDKALKKRICTDENTINNIAHRGNTASTTHFVAIWDHILSGKVHNGDNVVFGVTGSGQTIGTAIYTFDDLPDRIRRNHQAKVSTGKVATKRASEQPPEVSGPRVQIESIGTLPLNGRLNHQTLELTTQAARLCLDASQIEPREIELLMFAGMLRSGYICEPAIATLIGKELKLNDAIRSELDHKTLAFDVYNGAMGTLNACQAAEQLIRAGIYRTAMVVASEVDVNAACFPNELLDVNETASAFILRAAPDGQTGFGKFLFKYFPEHARASISYGWYRDGRPFCDKQVDPRWEDILLECIRPTVDELLRQEGLSRADVAAVLPPQFSSDFTRRLADVLGIAPERMIDVQPQGRDLFTSSLPYSLEHATGDKRVKPGDVGLVVNVGAGIQVGCATYHF